MKTAFALLAGLGLTQGKPTHSSSRRMGWVEEGARGACSRRSDTPVPAAISFVLPISTFETAFITPALPKARFARK